LPGVAVNVSCVFGAKLAVQVVGQLIPAGLLVMVPAPAAGAVTLTPEFGLNTGVTLAAAVIVKLQVPVPEQLPLHPPKE
jgi:hypothetical protein